MLTARDAMHDIVEGLNLGADDYLTKPFSFEELFARVRAAGRRGPAPRQVNLETGDLSLNQATREVRRGSRPITLTRTEFTHPRAAHAPRRTRSLPRHAHRNRVGRRQ